jgi:hypothetical protein
MELVEVIRTVFAYGNGQSTVYDILGMGWWLSQQSHVMELICLMEQDFDTPDVRSSLSNFDPTKEKKLLCKHAHKRDFFKSEGKITR